MSDQEINAAMDLLRVIRDDTTLARLPFSRHEARRREIVFGHAESVGKAHGLPGEDVRRALGDLLTAQWGTVTRDDIIQDEADLQRSVAR